MTPAARRWVVAAMLTSTFMAAAEVTIISTAMPTIVARLGGFNLFTWAFGVYLLGQAVTTPIYGRLADLYGRRVVYLGSTALFLLASLLCGLAWSMPALIVFRGLQGIGGGGLVPLATTIISDVASPADRTRQLSYISGIWGIAAIVGPLLGSLCVGTVGWPFVFWLNLPVGAFTIALVARHLKEPLARQAGGKIDAVGAALLTVGHRRRHGGADPVGHAADGGHGRAVGCRHSLAGAVRGAGAQGGATHAGRTSAAPQGDPGRQHVRRGLRRADHRGDGIPAGLGAGGPGRQQPGGRLRAGPADGELDRHQHEPGPPAPPAGPPGGRGGGGRPRRRRGSRC